jgi:hypothetical protein
MIFDVFDRFLISKTSLMNKNKSFSVKLDFWHRLNRNNVIITLRYVKSIHFMSGSNSNFWAKIWAEHAM